jgi:rubrerythrin
MSQEVSAQGVEDAILRTAIHMEEVGSDFYEALASASRDPEMIDLCRRLIADEKNHREMFKRMQAGPPSQGMGLAGSDGTFQEMCREARIGILPSRDAVRRVIQEGSVADLLELAVQMEQDAVRFYRGIAKTLPSGHAIEGVVREEQDHARLLLGELSRHGETNR